LVRFVHEGIDEVYIYVCLAAASIYLRVFGIAAKPPFNEFLIFFLCFIFLMFLNFYDVLM
jgi:hypothetical protein